MIVAPGTRDAVGAVVCVDDDHDLVGVRHLGEERILGDGPRGAGLLAWAYTRFGAIPQIAGILYGIKPVVIAVVLQALWNLAPKAVKKSVWLGGIGILAGMAFGVGEDAVVVLIAGGIASIVARQATTKKDMTLVLTPSVLGGVTAGGASVAAQATLVTLLLTFLKIGTVIFGSGYVLLAFLRTDLVDRLHWLTESQLLDAVAVGQVTPGPVLTTATFIGYVIAGGWGAVLATVGIFLPGFVLVAITRPIVARVRHSEVAASFLDGVNVVAVALMAVVTVQLGRAALVDALTIAIAIGAAMALIRFKLNTTWLIAGGALLGSLARALQ